MKRIVRLFGTVFALMVLGVATMGGQETLKSQADLEKFINMDAKDASTQFELLIQGLYQQQVASALILFNQRYGDRIQVDTVQFPSEKLLTIPGYIFSLKNRDKGKRYPGVVLVHGGFHDRFDTYIFPLLNAIVSAGYVVIFPEYRGSSGYGENHYQNAYGTIDVTDTIASADFLAKQDYVDGNRIGIVGHSRGGMVTLLSIERAPQRFKSAIEIAGLTDFVAYMSYKPDYRRAEVAKEASFGGKLPYENLEAYIRVSPINHVQDIQTPLLVLANTFDQTVPFVLHSGRLIDSLKAQGKTFDSHVYTNAPGGHMFPFADTDEGRDAFAGR